MREVPLHGERTLAAAPPARFDMVGLHWRGPGTVDFRTRSLTRGWTGWQRAAPEAEDLPNVETAEGRAAHGWRLGNPYWVGPSDAIAAELRHRLIASAISDERAHGVSVPVHRTYPLRPLDVSRPRSAHAKAWQPVVFTDHDALASERAELDGRAHHTE